MTFMKIIMVDMRTRMFVHGWAFARDFYQSLPSLTSCSVSCTKDTVLGLHQVDLPSHLQNREQYIQLRR